MMKRSLRRTMFLVPATLAVLVLGVPSAAGGPLDVRLSCNDGTDLELTLDAETVNQLQDTVLAMSLHPAGDPPLTCSLDVLTAGSWVPLTLPAAHADPNGPKDFAVGGGQFFNQFVGCQENFAVSAHVPADTAATAPQAGAGGTVNLSFPSTCTNPVFTGSHLVSKVDCVRVTGNTADMTAEITKSTGGFAAFFPEGNEIAWQVKDLDPPLFDEIVGQPTTSECNFTAASNQGVFPVLRGNITVRDA